MLKISLTENEKTEKKKKAVAKFLLKLADLNKGSNCLHTAKHKIDLLVKALSCGTVTSSVRP